MLGITRVNSGGNVEKISMAYKKWRSSWLDPNNVCDDIYAIVGKNLTIKGKGKIINDSTEIMKINYTTSYLRYRNPLLYNNAYFSTITGLLYNIFDKIIFDVDINNEGDTLEAYFMYFGRGRDSGPNDYANKGIEIDMKIKAYEGCSIGSFAVDCIGFFGKITLDIKTGNYGSCFKDLGYATGGVTVNYSTKCTNIDQIIATKGNGKVFKGTLI